MVIKRSWLRKIAGALPGVGLAGLLAFNSWQAHAQEPAANPGPARAYLNKTTINLPILIDDRHRAQLDSVHLYVKEGPSQPWRLCDKAAPTQTSFIFRARGEGEYWFNIVSVDKVGRLTPADVTKEAPALIVVIDTKAPQVELQPLHQTAEGQFIRCSCRDAHLDAYKSKLFYQTGDQVWRQLEALPGKADLYCIPAQAAWTGSVRAVAVDLANNTTMREMNLSNLVAGAAVQPEVPLPPPGGLQQVSVPPVTYLPPPQPTATQVQEPSAPMPTRGRSISANEVIVAPAAAAAASMPVEPLPQLPPEKNTIQTAQTAAPQKATPTPATPAAPQLFDAALAHKTPPLVNSADVKTTSHLTRDLATMPRQFTNSARQYLDYRIEAMGASGVGKVEVWYTRDLGQSWQKLCEDAKRQSPVEINLPGDGIYGVTLVITNGRGFGGTPPVSGDTPDSWIEVDTTKPVAELTQIRNGTGDDSAALHITWSARDKNLAGDSVELQFAATREGPWKSIAKGLKSDGVYRWLPPVEVGPQAFIRLTVRDQANNVSVAETTQPVALDDASRPRGRVVGFSTSVPRTGSSGSENQ